MAQPPVTASTPVIAAIIAILLHFIEHTPYRIYGSPYFVASYRKRRANLASRPYLLKQKHFRKSYGGAVMSNCRMLGTRNGQLASRRQAF
jgi:hypothetical protein